tara:strand:+ start:629 stop:937 length:309 start_codon:yes stop_codon:yes gene_type:complete
MPITNTITSSKSGSSFTSAAEAVGQIQEDINTPIWHVVLINYLDEGKLTFTDTFDVNTQALTSTRVWDDAAYAEWNTANSADRATIIARLETLGWTITDTVA